MTSLSSQSILLSSITVPDTHDDSRVFTSFINPISQLPLLLVGTQSGKILKIQKYKNIGWKLTDVITLDELKNKEITKIKIISKNENEFIVAATTEHMISSFNIIQCDQYFNSQSCSK